MNVLIRKWKEEDAARLALLANNKKIADHLRDRFPYPYQLQDAEQWIRLQKEKVPVLNFAIDADEQLAGACGILLKEDVYRHSAEIGYWIGEPFWGRGIATAAISQLLEHLQKEFSGICRIYAEVFDCNTPSMRVLEKNGFVLECTRKKAVIKNNTIIDDHVWVLFPGH
ncbi:MAG: GNAT family N-acetyltransferase [Terrimonas sp.]|nr:GNAT family N-acetyltransferase [Terrimonas sp.]